MEILTKPIKVSITRATNISKEKKYNDLINLKLYDNLFSSNAKLINIGAGNFNHPRWLNVDFYSTTDNKKNKIDIFYDLNSNETLPFDNESVDIVYSSHTIEHVFKKNVFRLVEELKRILKKNGIIRFVYPNIDLAVKAYFNNDKDFFYMNPKDYSLEKNLTSIFAMNLNDSNSPNFIDELEIRKIMHEMRSIDALDYLEDLNNKNPEVFFRPDYHRSWWNFNLLKTIFKKNNFSEIYASSFGQSSCPILRDTSIFDNTHPKLSGYLEVKKL